MKKILVCQHVAHELLGTLNPLFKEAGFRIRYVNFGRYPEIQPSLKDYFGLVILGGPMNVDEAEKYPHLAYEIKLIEEAIVREIPVLGICLGAQLIAKTLGGIVTKNPEKEIGWCDVSLTPEGKNDPLLRHFQKNEKLFQWHEDAFSLPKGCVPLATSGLCMNQAFRYGSKVYGFQFHLEVDERIIERWLKISSQSPERIREETPRHIDRLRELSRKIFGEFIKLFGVEKKFRGLVSR